MKKDYIMKKELIFLPNTNLLKGYPKFIQAKSELECSPVRRHSGVL